LHSAFDVEKFEDFMSAETPNRAAVQGYKANENKGPDGNDLLIDFKDKINSKWNKRAINLLADYVCKKLRRLELPKRSEGYVTDVIQEYVKRAAGYWRQAQPKLMESGKHESPEHLEKRLISRRAKLGQKARANTRRSEVRVCHLFEIHHLKQQYVSLRCFYAGLKL
jgi:hypothetical protein